MNISREKQRKHITSLYNSLVKFYDYIEKNKDLKAYQRKHQTSLRKELKEFIAISKFYTRKDKLARKQQTYEYYKKNSENGFVVIVTEGMDCDGGQYRHIGDPMALVPVKIDKAIDIAYEWSDGYMNHYIVTPSEAEKMQNVSIDRGMEAFENGHSHTFRMGGF